MLAAQDLSNEVNRQEHTAVILGHDFRSDLINFLHVDLPKIIVILIMAFVMQRVVSFFVGRMRKLAEKQVGNSQRAAQLRTLAALFRATAYGIISFIALMQILPIFNIDLKPLLASAGVVGLGISFGAQSIFKDMLNGIFIFLEDQFNVGDVIKIAGLQGTVEDLSLRATTLRDSDGTQYFIPNSQIATVSNLSREYSIATLSLSVDAEENPDLVMEILNDVSQQVRKDPAFAQVMLADPSILGVDNIRGHEVIYPINLRVRANQKDPVLRELRRRILIEFRKNNISLGSTSTILLQRDLPATTQPGASN